MSTHIIRSNSLAGQGEKENHKVCVLCGSREFLPLPGEWPSSATTAGMIVEEPLAKAQCASCSLLQRFLARHLGATDFYEQHYSFYERPGASVYDKQRYASMAQWIADSIAPLRPLSILDGGCGRGWMMEAVRAVYPDSSITGVEPSEQESENARRAGLKVVSGRVDEYLDLGEAYDLAYSTNVVEHTTDPIDFLRSLARLVKTDGRIAILCPESSTPSCEFMFSDQNYSFTPQQLARIGELAGLHVAGWGRDPGAAVLKEKQLMVFSKVKTGKIDLNKLVPPVPPKRLFKERCEYVALYTRLEEHLLERTRGFDSVYHFGTSTWGFLIAAYCPQYWKKVSFCVIDGGSGTFQGKDVKDLKEIPPASNGIFVLGVSPQFQPILAKRLAKARMPSVTWDHIIVR